MLCDLQGPKFRTESLAAEPVELVEGRNFARDTAQSRHAGGSSAVGCAAVDLPREVLAGDVPLLNDGAIVLKANRVEGTRVETFVQLGGSLGNRKGTNRQGGRPLCERPDRQGSRGHRAWSVA